MSAKAEDIGNPFEPQDPTWLYPNNHTTLPLSEPGFVRFSGGSTDATVAIKSPIYRPGDELRELPRTYTGDCVPVIKAISEAPFAVTERRQGVEAELNAVCAQEGSPFNLYPGDKALPLPSITDHPELLRNTAEVSGAPNTSTARAYLSVLIEAARTNIALAKYGAMVDPAAARMQDTPSKEDITPNRYVETMAATLGEKILRFVGTGVHEHNELHIALSPIVSRYLRILAPHLNAGLLAAPFGFGEQNPHLGEILNSDELRAYDGVQPQSIRYPTRFAASPNGGVGLYVAHDTLPEALSHADRMMADGPINNPARQFGAHSDIRNRYDAISEDQLDHPGRIELCFKDTGALRYQTLVAYGELTRAIIEQLERAALEGEAGVAQLHEEFPNLFGKSYDSDALASEQLPRAHENSLAIAYYGAQAAIVNGTGTTVEASEHFREIIKFATSRGMALPESVRSALFKSIQPLHVAESTMTRYKDNEQLPSLVGYYKTGVGTAAQWMIVRAMAAENRGIKPAERMRSGTLDRGQAFKRHLASVAGSLAYHNHN